MKIKLFSRLHIFGRYLSYVCWESQNWSTYNIVDNIIVVGIAILNCVGIDLR